MTRENIPAAQSAARRAASLLTGALMLTGLAGCSSSLFQSATADASLTKNGKPAVALASPEGVPQKYASKVNDQLATFIKAKGVQLVEAKDAQYVIKTSFLALPEPKHGTKVTYTIDVTDKAGNKVRSIGGEELVSTKQGGDSATTLRMKAFRRSRPSRQQTSHPGSRIQMHPCLRLWPALSQRR